MAAVLGIAEHNGWAEFVAVGARGSAPVVHDRYRVALRDADLPSQPYHHEALAMPLAEARPLVDRIRDSVARHARAALAEARARHGLVAVVLQESPFPQLPGELADVLASWNLTCAADGMMYREALADGAASLGLDVVRYPRKAKANQVVAEHFGVTLETVAALVRELGKPLGTPWREEHRRATAMGIWALARYEDIRL